MARSTCQLAVTVAILSTLLYIVASDDASCALQTQCKSCVDTKDNECYWCNKDSQCYQSEIAHSKCSSWDYSTYDCGFQDWKIWTIVAVALFLIVCCAVPICICICCKFLECCCCSCF